MLKRYLFLSLLLISSITGFSQELNCSVSVSSQKIQGTNREIFRNMQKDIYEFMNTSRWTDNLFAYDERIECNMVFTLSEQLSVDEFKGSLQVQVRRPVYNSSYNSVIFNFKDNDIHFKYQEFQPLTYNDNSKNTNLVSLLAYYSNIILGLDYDTFSIEGGSVYFSKAEAIVARCQNNAESGWKSFESRHNRYWLIENIQDNSFSPFRECLYRYHRQGLDAMENNVMDGRSVVAESLELLRKVYRQKPNSMILQLFFDAKADEIMNIFSNSFGDERKRVYNVLAEVNPSNISKYKSLLENN